MIAGYSNLYTSGINKKGEGVGGYMWIYRVYYILWYCLSFQKSVKSLFLA